MLRTGTKVRLVFFSPFHGQEQNEDNNCLLLHGQNTKNMTGVSRPKTTRRRGRYRHEAGGEGNSKGANRKKKKKDEKKKFNDKSLLSLSLWRSRKQTDRCR